MEVRGMCLLRSDWLGSLETHWHRNMMATDPWPASTVLGDGSEVSSQAIKITRLQYV